MLKVKVLVSVENKKGLVNLGETCYVIAILQPLYYTTGFLKCNSLVTGKLT